MGSSLLLELAFADRRPGRDGSLAALRRVQLAASSGPVGDADTVHISSGALVVAGLGSPGRGNLMLLISLGPFWSTTPADTSCGAVLWGLVGYSPPLCSTTTRLGGACIVSSPCVAQQRQGSKYEPWQPSAIAFTSARTPHMGRGGHHDHTYPALATRPALFAEPFLHCVDQQDQCNHAIFARPGSNRLCQYTLCE